ncbi:MAG TPA: aldo/keto reductase [Desulfotomaculum sp.]|nr:aldo/keto reductase [Desulfotomaculum sp.]
MEYRMLGESGILVSRLCFGALTVGPLQVNLALSQGAAVIRHALEAGINFIDTAELYDTYPYIKEALQGLDKRVVIATKSYAYTGEGMGESLNKALRSLGREYIDIFLLHEQESALTIRGHWGAVECLVKAKEAGLVRAIGISTHSVEGVRAAALIPEFDIIQPLINITGIGIRDGGREEMLAAIREAALLGKGIYGMKALGGGNLLDRADEALGFVFSIPELAAVAVGMSSTLEVDFNAAFFTNRTIPQELRARVNRQNRRLIIEDWCPGCGQCIKRCGAGALMLVEGRAVVDQSRCRLCGYCGAVCPEFCIKIV